MIGSSTVIPMVPKEHEHQSFNKYMVSTGLQTGREKILSSEKIVQVFLAYQYTCPLKQGYF